MYKTITVTAACIILLALGVGAVRLVAQLLSSAPNLPPQVAWSTNHIRVTLLVGATRERQPTFTTTVNLQDVRLEAVPEIERFVIIQPVALATVSSAQKQTIRFSFSVPVATSVGTYSGTVHIKVKGRTLPQILNVTVIVVRALTAEQTILELSDELAAGDVEAAAKRFASDRDSAFLSQLSHTALETLAGDLRRARLKTTGDKYRTYLVPFKEADGSTDETEFMLAQTIDGEWTIISW